MQFRAALLTMLCTLSGLFEGLGKLIRAGSGLKAAPNALEPLDGLLRRHAPHQGRDALQIAAAAADNFQFLNHSLIVHLDPHGLGADASGVKCICHSVSLFPIEYTA